VLYRFSKHEVRHSVVVSCHSERKRRISRALKRLRSRLHFSHYIVVKLTTLALLPSRTCCVHHSFSEGGIRYLL